MRDLSIEVTAEKAKDENKPVELYTVYLGEATLYLAAYREKVEFYDEEESPQTYYAAGLSRTAIRTNVKTRVDECSVSLDNVNREMSSYIAHTDFNGRRCKIIKVFLDLLDDPEHATTVFDGIMDAPSVSEKAMTITVRSRLDTLGVQTPRRRYRKLCNWKFGSPECGIDLATVTVTGTVSAISPDRKTLTLSGRGEAAGHYVDGVLTIETENRHVLESNGATVTVDYPFGPDIEASDTYTLRRGCNKTLDESCEGRFLNSSNYGGFVSVPVSD